MMIIGKYQSNAGMFLNRASNQNQSKPLSLSQVMHTLTTGFFFGSCLSYPLFHPFLTSRPFPLIVRAITSCKTQLPIKSLGTWLSTQKVLESLHLILAAAAF